MANHSSAEKRHRQSLRRRDRNRAIRSLCRSSAKKTTEVAAAGDLEKARELLRKTEKALASAATKHGLHKKNASRKISRLTKLVNKKNS